MRSSSIVSFDLAFFSSTSFIDINGAVNRMQFRIKERKKRREKQSKEKKFHSEENYLYYKN